MNLVDAPRVSVLIPCFNGADFVGEAIESALNQSWANVEVVVVDDGSTDESVSVLRQFGNRIVHEVGPNKGACEARNRAFELCTGDLIQFLDADDLLCSNKFELQVPVLASGEADLTFSHGYIFGDGKPERKKKSKIANPEGVDPFVYCLHQGLSTEGPLICREFVSRVGGFRVGLRRGQEWDFHVRVAAAGARIHFDERHLYRHRHDDRSDRITRRTLPPDYHMLQLVELANCLASNSIYAFDNVRRSEFATLLNLAASSAFRAGCRDSAKLGFETASRINLGRHARTHGSSILRILSQVLGPFNAERLRSLLRRYKHKKTIDDV